MIRSAGHSELALLELPREIRLAFLLRSAPRQTRLSRAASVHSQMEQRDTRATGQPNNPVRWRQRRPSRTRALARQPNQRRFFIKLRPHAGSEGQFGLYTRSANVKTEPPDGTGMWRWRFLPRRLPPRRMHIQVFFGE